MKRATLMTGAASLALLMTTPAFAQTADQAPAAETTENAGEIIVTAQKRSERLQDVPLAVTVVSGDTLAATGKVSLEGAQYLVPTLNFLKSGTTLNQSLFLRGVGTATFSIAGEPSVSTVLDGVVFSRAGEAFSDLLDIERIEVLRGPQGTLFGKNASAGVINIVSKRPTREFSGYGELGFFTDSEYRARCHQRAADRKCVVAAQRLLQQLRWQHPKRDAQHARQRVGTLWRPVADRGRADIGPEPDVHRRLSPQ